MIEQSPSTHWEQAAEAVLAGVPVAYNEYGTPVSVHVCTTCGEEFTVCPPSSGGFGDECLDPGCNSYDPTRDAMVLFGGELGDVE